MDPAHSLLLRDGRGTLLESLIVIGLVALIAIGAFNTFGDKLNGFRSSRRAGDARQRRRGRHSMP